MTMELVTLKTLYLNECAALMAHEPLWKHYGVTLERAQRLFFDALYNEDDNVWLMLVDGEVAGFAWFSLRGAFHHGGYLRYLAVHPHHRGARIGQKLLTVAEDNVRGFNEHIFLLVSDFNHDAQRFYQRQRYRQVGALPGFILPDVTELIYWKRL